MSIENLLCLAGEISDGSSSCDPAQLFLNLVVQTPMAVGHHKHLSNCAIQFTSSTSLNASHEVLLLLAKEGANKYPPQRK